MQESSETKRVKLSTAMDVLAFRTDRNLWKQQQRQEGADAGAEGKLKGEGEGERPGREIQRLMSRLNALSLPIRRTLGDFQRFKVTPQDHVNYAATWFTLAVATWAMAYARVRSTRWKKLL